MKVVRVRNENNHIRYYLNDDNGEPIEEILKFLKFKDNTGYARNTLRMYCTHLKQYYEYLAERGKFYREVNIVFCKYFFPKVASCFSPLLQVDFPQYCKSRFPHHLRCENHDIAGKNN